MPYNTKAWQFGDAEEANGKFALEMTKNKRTIIETKSLHGYPPTIHATDIVPLVLRSWENSFQSIPSNRIPLSERGWRPLTYSLLDSEHIHDIRVSHNSRLVKAERYMLM